MTNTEKKQTMWQELSKKYTHLENFCTIELVGIYDDSPYFHPKFIINDDVYITSQADVGNNYIYAIRFVCVSKQMNIDISDDLLPALIIGYHTNYESVEFAMITLQKVINQLSILNNYVYDYINNILIGNSINDVTDSIVNELRANKQIISHLQTKKTI